MNNKYNKLKEYIKNCGSLCVAFSGGVDSTFLLTVAYEVLGDKALAVTVKSSMYTQREFNEAKDYAQKLGVKHIIIESNEYDIKEFVDNTKERCYYCKKAIFSKIKSIALEHGINYVADGSNADDINDYRPGLKAIKELEVLSPLKAVGLTKKEIRILSKELHLPTWDKPSMACLASRIPYGMKIARERLFMVEQAEDYLMKLGFKQFRVRYHGEIARIEILKEDRNKFLNEISLEDLILKFKELGFTYITLDLEGYRTGSMNEVLTEKDRMI